MWKSDLSGTLADKQQKHARAVAEEAARASYGRLLAWLASRTNDVAAAEDALSDAFRAALEHWPKSGVPNSPEAWLLTAARRKLIDGARKRQTHANAEPALLLATEEAEVTARVAPEFPDERLKLLFMCAHPAIDEGVRTPLMLQTVLGLDAARIASAFLTSPAAMSGRLVRAKRKIKTARIPFDTPGETDLPDRLEPVLAAIYAAYGTGWEAVGGAEAEIEDLTQEAIYLAELAVSLMPDQAEALGLVALMLHAEARKKARRAEGAYVPLERQDIALWDRDMIAKAEHALAHAWKFGQIGQYQLEAAIQSAHAASRLQERDTRQDIATLYERLVAIAPSAGAFVGYAAALTAADRHDDALDALVMMIDKAAERYQPYWAVRARIMKNLGRASEANEALTRAIGLSKDPAVRAFLSDQKTD